MKAALFHLILDETTALLTHVPQHLREYELQRIIANSTSGRAFRVFHRLVAVVADVERRTIEVARILGGITVDTTQTAHILLGTQHAGDDKAVQRYTFIYRESKKACPMSCSSTAARGTK